MALGDHRIGAGWALEEARRVAGSRFQVCSATADMDFQWEERTWNTVHTIVAVAAAAAVAFEAEGVEDEAARTVGVAEAEERKLVEVVRDDSNRSLREAAHDSTVPDNLESDTAAAAVEAVEHSCKVQASD